MFGESDKGMNSPLLLLRLVLSLKFTSREQDADSINSSVAVRLVPPDSNLGLSGSFL